jgi:ABC-type dipeptide/oligopeptide/nickel transport system permease component
MIGERIGRIVELKLMTQIISWIGIIFLGVICAAKQYLLADAGENLRQTDWQFR